MDSDEIRYICEKTFKEYKLLANRVSLLGGIVQNPDFVRYDVKQLNDFRNEVGNILDDITKSSTEVVKLLVSLKDLEVMSVNSDIVYNTNIMQTLSGSVTVSILQELVKIGYSYEETFNVITDNSVPQYRAFKETLFAEY